MTAADNAELYPTRNRLALAHGIAAKQVRQYPGGRIIWRRDDGLTEQTVTSDTGDFIHHQYAAVAPGEPRANGLLVELTDAGWAWLDKHGGAK